jgi:hypothetical protein
LVINYYYILRSEIYLELHKKMRLFQKIGPLFRFDMSILFVLGGVFFFVKLFVMFIIGQPLHIYANTSFRDYFNRKMYPNFYKQMTRAGAGPYFNEKNVKDKKQVTNTKKCVKILVTLVKGQK